MRKYRILLTLAPVLALILLIVLSMFLFTVQETEIAIITQFGRPVGKPITTAGLHFKLPLVQTANILNKWTMEWDGQPEEVPTKDKLFIFVDTYARWRIKDALAFYQALRNEAAALSRLDDILDGETRNVVAKHTLIELVRTDKARRPIEDQAMTSAGVAMAMNWQPISQGRDDITKEIFDNSSDKLMRLGIELIDIRFKRINYNKGVQDKIFERMISERKQIAERFRSEGQGEAAKILGEQKRTLQEIESGAYRTTQEIQGGADAKATAIYATAYNQSPEAYQFYQFQKTLETYLTTLDRSTTMILSTQGDYFKFLKNVEAGTTGTTGTMGMAGTTKPAPAAAKPTPAKTVTATTGTAPLNGLGR